LQFLLSIEFGNIDWTGFSCDVVLTDDIIAEIKSASLDYFIHAAIKGFQFEKFEAAWCAWLEANAKFDWTEIRLQEKIEAILYQDFQSNNDLNASEQSCQCTAKILSSYGVQYHEWMGVLIHEGKDWSAFGAPPEPIFNPCDGIILSAETSQKIKVALVGTSEAPGFYQDKVEVSYRLWLLLDLLSNLTNVYPTATLHDCDDGSDVNPVRLNMTALGGI
jgi:hypothetical protein